MSKNVQKKLIKYNILFQSTSVYFSKSELKKYKKNFFLSFLDYQKSIMQGYTLKDIVQEKLVL